jgi:HSP20 family protein
VHEDAEAYELVAPVPGLAADDVHIEVEDDVLTLRGKAPQPENGNGAYLLREIAPMEFERRLRLPLPVDAARAEASLQNGVLKLRIPKAEEARPKTIPVRAG